MHVFRPFLEPPKTIASLPIVGSITTRSLMTIGVFAVMVIGITSLIGIPIFVGLILGAVFGLVFDRSSYQNEPFAPMILALVRYWLERGIRPTSITFDVATINEEFRVHDADNIIIFDAEGNILLYQEQS